jgi:hypothetical protein
MAVSPRGYLLDYEVVTKDLGFAKRSNRYHLSQNSALPLEPSYPVSNFDYHTTQLRGIAICPGGQNPPSNLDI